ncbi:DNA packaging terminase subunit 2 [Saimiriine betaherpesvirus 4]|uniref:DNA packaging terminase subunit 2 n=1 Tax=Saimiriine betaherpesvirus 4 TaxID=1535247 RepID=G8XSX1_9BETA|nr:DNA packaging terminase subunit 2 [Saimiriine betaherpesvirus 4]AEV80917.1 DNA packaging terminase subunit 2 [Saimiriine betaherpesvirus 4]
MNLLQKLCVVCSKCNEYAMELECLKYCDPSILLAESSPFKRNALAITRLYRRIYPELVKQNHVQTSLLTLYMEVSLKALYEDTEMLDQALMKYSQKPDRMEYYRTILRLDRCERHHVVELKFTDDVKFSVPLGTLNEVERFLCKMNCVYAVMSPDHGLEICCQLLRLLRSLCGISPVACPEVYADGITCAQCYEELTVVPNQGRSLNKRLQGLLCNHIAVHRPCTQSGTNMQTVEQDLSEYVHRIPKLGGLVSTIKALFSSSSVSHSYIHEAEETLKEYNLFTDIPERIYSLSDFTYWSRTSEILVKRVDTTINQLNVYHSLCRLLMNEISRYMYGEEVEDIFVLGEKILSGEERLFVGSVFAAPNRIIDLITSMSIQAFEENPAFNRLHENNEMYSKIKSLLEEIRRPSEDEAVERPVRSGSEVETVGATGAAEAACNQALECGDPRVNMHNITREVNLRKRAYLQKVSEVGYNKVMRCIKNQEKLTNKLIDVNLVGTTCLDLISKMMNGFIDRNKFKDDATVIDVCEDLSYDEHLYVVNNLIHKKLPVESLPTLGQQIYRLCNGPLFTHCQDRYPMSHNVDMAYACDNAGVLPHVKDDLVKYAEGTVHPHEWMVVKYLCFFNFTKCDDLNALQKEMWAHVRELVLSVALYNEAFGKDLSILQVRECTLETDGIILTYNRDWPLILKSEERLYKSKDLYLLLYRHLVQPGETPTIFREPERPISSIEYSSSERRRLRKRHRDGSFLLDLVREDVEGVFVPKCLY